MSSLASEFPLVSIIVPVFNVEPYLVRCLNSVVNQNLENIEVILIYDNSSDKSFDICMQFIDENKNFSLHHGHGKGVGSARNCGINLARGEYVFFLDSDDWVEPTMCKDMCDLMSLHHPDFINFGFVFLNSDGNVLNKNKKYKNAVLNGRSIFINSFLDLDIYSVIWNKCYSLSFLKNNNIFFPEVPEWEDVLFTRKLAYFSEKTLFSSVIYYNALVRANSRSRSISSKFLMDCINLLRIEEEFIKSIDKNNEYDHLFKAHYVKIITFFKYKALFEIGSISQLFECLDVINKSNYWEFSRIQGVRILLTFKLKILISMCKYPRFLRLAATLLKHFNVKTY